MSIVIKTEDVSKLYRLGAVGASTLKDDAHRLWARLRGHEDPTILMAETNDRTQKGTSDYVWALKDINFEVEEGVRLGIIGKNGAGKSTLLKILSKVTAPTTGAIKVKGRIASLLEVGTGFHPELTGKENIFLNGHILGMTRQEIARKFDEIVDFAGVEKYLDTPVKRYSSGMYVRLAFAVAAHLEPEILIVDEVLAVGDAEFQKKCLGKMSDVSKNDGRTILFVSHNIAAVKSLCNKAIVMEYGKIKFNGNTTEAASVYLKGDSKTDNRRIFGSDFDRPDFTLHEISLNAKGENSESPLDEYHEIELHTHITIKNPGKKLHITYHLNNENGETLFSFSHARANLKLEPGLNHLTCFLPKGFLNSGTYYLSFFVIENLRTGLFIEKDILSFDIHTGERELGNWLGKEPGFIKPVFEWIQE